MLPSERLFFNRDDVYDGNRYARQRAWWLYDDVLRDVEKAPELGPGRPSQEKTKSPFPRLRGNDPEKSDALARKWNVIAEVAEGYPRLLTWLAEGQASTYWNVFGAWMAILRLIPGVRTLIIWNLLLKPVARRAAWRPALYEAILQQQRLHDNEKADRNTDFMVIRGPGIPGLSAVAETAVITPTGGRAAVRRKIVNMTSGCIGISALRGAGKTTLIQDICAHRYGTPRFRSPDDTIPPENYLPGLRIMVQAPVRFEPQDFLIHQYTCLCRAVLADVRFNPTSPADLALGPVLLPRSIRLAALLGSVSGLVLLAVSGVLAFRVVDGGWPFFSLNTEAWEVVGVIAAFGGALVALAWRTRRLLIEIRQVNNLAFDAAARLRKLRFQRTDTRSRGATVGGPGGTGLSLGTTRQYAEQAMTLPELIDDYRDFVERVVAALQEEWHAYRKKWQEDWEKLGREHKPRPAEDPARTRADVRLIFGIDELDQIDDPRQAAMFLSDLSATFKIPHCVHIISLSPGTLAAVDQRMVPLKMSSGGIFDEMVWLDPLGLHESRQFLDRRVTGLPDCFIALIYVLSGGLPRELARVARAIFTTHSDQRADQPPPVYPVEVRFADAVTDVIDAEIRAFKHRTIASAATLGDSAAAALLTLLNDDSWPVSQLGPGDHARQPSSQVREVLHKVSDRWHGPARSLFADMNGEVAAYTAEVCNSLLVDLYFLLTARQFFTGDPARVTEQEPVLRDLARARIALAGSPYLAESLIREARKDARFADFAFGPDIELRFLRPGSATVGAG